MAIHIPDNDSYKDIEQAIKELAIKERRSIAQQTMALVEEALNARTDREVLAQNKTNS